MKHPHSESSPYWNYLRNEFQELPVANPDVLVESEGFKWFMEASNLSQEDEENLQAYERVMSKGFLIKLSKREQQIWLQFIQGFRAEEISLCLKIKRQAVYVYLKRIGTKFKRAILKERHLYHE